MKKLILLTLFTALLICVFAFGVSAKEIEKYCDAKITLTTGETVTAYFEIGYWGNKPSVVRDTIYKSTNTDDGTYSWSDVSVLDFRNFNYTEGYAPEFMHGTNCNNLASNVTTVYLPSTIKEILNTSFTSGWKSLDTVYIGKELTSINYNAFRGSAIKHAVIEEGSKLKTIGREAFRECYSLTSINLQEGLETIDYCAFYLSGLSGKFVVPNSVTSIGDAAFRTTKIETLVLGDGPVKLGYNLVGNDGTNKEYLKNIYVSAQSTFNESHLSEIWFASTSPINFYVVGDSEEEISSFITSIKSTGRVKFATEQEIESGTAVSGYNAIIIEGYNKCDAFYNSNHTVADASLEYIDAVSEFYQSGNCSMCNKKVIIDTYEPVLDFIGYSVKDDGTSLCVGYGVNYASYEALTVKFGKTLTYGVIAAVAEANNSFLEIKDGKVSVIENKKAVLAEVSRAYASFEFKLTGFTEAYLNTGFVLCAYSYDGNEISYLTVTSKAIPSAVTCQEVLNQKED